MLDKTKTPYLDDNMNLGIYKRDLKAAKDIKNRIKKIAKIIKELKKFI